MWIDLKGKYKFLFKGCRLKLKEYLKTLLAVTPGKITRKFIKSISFFLKKRNFPI
jgi:hypothetical protein